MQCSPADQGITQSRHASTPESQCHLSCLEQCPAEGEAARLACPLDYVAASHHQAKSWILTAYKRQGGFDLVHKMLLSSAWLASVWQGHYSVDHLLQSLLHLLKVRLLVEVGRHDLGNQRLQDIGKEEQQHAAQQA